jgi:hypothetical protein
MFSKDKSKYHVLPKQVIEIESRWSRTCDGKQWAKMAKNSKKCYFPQNL